MKRGHSIQHQDTGVRSSLPFQRQLLGGGGPKVKPPAPTPPPAPPAAAQATAPARTIIAQYMPKKGRASTNFGGANSSSNKTILGTAFRAS
jgi:hypothetical protein